MLDLPDQNRRGSPHYNTAVWAQEDPRPIMTVRIRRGGPHPPVGIEVERRPAGGDVTDPVPTIAPVEFDAVRPLAAEVDPEGTPVLRQLGACGAGHRAERREGPRPGPCGERPLEHC